MEYWDTYKIKYKGEEIPEDIKFWNYYSYIKKLPYNFKDKERSEWTDEDLKEFHAMKSRLSVAHSIAKWKNDSLTKRQKQIIEYVRNGTDFDVSDEELDKLFKQAR